MRRVPWFLPAAALALASGGAYLLYAGSKGALGFPLDDAWIHQTYARNLALHGQWSYDARNASAGSTSPLWTIVLAVGYLVGIDGQVWGQSLGLASAVFAAILVARLTARLVPGRRLPPFVAAGLCAFEWHVTWASLSGMETLLFAALGLLCLDLYLSWEAGERGSPAARGLVAGVCGGVLVLARPEGLVLLAFIALAYLLRVRWGAGPAGPWQWGIWAAVGVLLPLVPYAAFNLRTTGLIFPSTFYAKQAEYAALLGQTGLAARLGAMLAALLAGVGVVLAPGFLVGLADSLARRRSAGLLLGAWVIASWLLYALRLPVTYQHGRYLIPTLPAYFSLAVAGGFWLLDRARSRPTRVIGRAWCGASAVVLVAFWLIGAGAYTEDVGFINGEMGRAATWLRANTPPGSRIAAHDIGLLGYRVECELTDLAGLVTPEVIPFMHDPDRLMAFMERRQVEYIILFPDWSDAYRALVRDSRFTAVYDTGFEWTTRRARENMTVYRADWSQRPLIIK